jgi:sodium/hydrogen exchanger 8
MSLHKGNFFRNLGSIVTFAVVGTLISTLFVGLLLFATTAIGASSPDMSLLECLIFGALISAVDPVATLAIFHALEVDPTLYMLVFGESVLNDGVSIVLFRTFVSFVGLEGAGSPVVTVIKAIGLFLFTTFASVSIGVLSGAGTALLFKHTRLGDYPSLELALYLIMSYLPYLLAEALSLSGIMAILFCGIVNAHYTHFNLTPATQSTTQQCFRMFAFAAEALIFAYLGLAIFTFDHSFHWGLVLWGMLGILAGRALNIYPLSAAVNRFRYVPIPRQDQFIMWFSRRDRICARAQRPDGQPQQHGHRDACHRHGHHLCLWRGHHAAPQAHGRAQGARGGVEPGRGRPGVFVILGVAAPRRERRRAADPLPARPAGADAGRR